jgi:predicted 3-demethylubiquinone-9 3-methyltransferase (glyoxalase superfamily)
MEKITPCLWFDGQGEEAMKLYASIFPGSLIVETSPGPNGKILTGIFELFGRRYMVLNGGPDFKFTEALSLSVSCENQAEVDRYWSALLAGGGQESQCGWLKDKFGLSWQIVPKQLPEFLNHPDREKANRAMQAMLGMRKLDVAALERAFEGA